MSSPGTPLAAVNAAPEKAKRSTTIVVPRRSVSTMRLLRRCESGSRGSQQNREMGYRCVINTVSGCSVCHAAKCIEGRWNTTAAVWSIALPYCGTRKKHVLNTLSSSFGKSTQTPMRQSGHPHVPRITTYRRTASPSGWRRTGDGLPRRPAPPCCSGRRRSCDRWMWSCPGSSRARSASAHGSRGRKSGPDSELVRDRGRECNALQQGGCKLGSSHPAG